MFKEVDLTKGPITKALLTFALPMFFSMLFQQLYNTMDTMIVGNTLGDTSLAAIGATAAIYELMVGFALGVGNGLSIVLARAYGAKDEATIKKSVAGSIVIGFFLTIGIMLISRVLLYPLLQLLETPVEIIDESYSYISTITTFVGVMFIYNLGSGLLRSIGNSVMPLIFLIISSVINVVLDYVFIVYGHRGIRGAAEATVIAQAISGLLCIIYIMKKTPILICSRKDFHVGKRLYKELIGQGFSMGLMGSIVSIGTVILQSAINPLGYKIIAGHTAARKLNSFCSMPALTVSMAIATFVSQNKGANQKERIKQGLKISFNLSIVWAAIVTVLLLFGAESLVQVISGSKDPSVVVNGAMYLKINAPFYCVLGALLSLRNGLQGLGRKVIPLVSSVIELVGKIAFVYLLIPTMGYLGVIWCEPIVWCCMCLQLWYAFYHDPYIING